MPRVLAALLLAACGGATKRAATPSTVRAPCADTAYFDGKVCVPRGDGAALIEDGAAALAAFDVDKAVALLERARAAGPHRHGDYVRLYEQLGIAYAYLEREADALAAFEMLLVLEPGHLLSYTLSPRATFLFEKARTAMADRPAPAVDLSWPRNLDTEDPVPIDIEVVADPSAFLRRAELHVRRAGASASYEVIDVPLPQAGYRRVVLPATRGAANRTLEIYVRAYDDAGNEVLVWADPDRPREIPVRYDPPSPWYRKWWVWAVAGTVVAVGTGTTVFALTRDPPSTVDGDFVVSR